MPYIQEFTRSLDLDWIEHRDPVASHLIDNAISAGKTVVWERSSFTDPGEDWNRVLVDGVVVYHENGY